MQMPNRPINAYEYRRFVTLDIYPITGGPIRKPRKLTLDTIVRAILVDIFVLFPAMLYMVGTIPAVPNPMIMKPIIVDMK